MNVTEVSLAENALQEPMHPADQYEAFAALIAQGMSIEDATARFGVAPKLVTLHFELAAVSPKLMQFYRDGSMNLEQLSVFCISYDRGKQEEVGGERSLAVVVVLPDGDAVSRLRAMRSTAPR